MKISISGPQCCGKSTLLNDIKQTFQSKGKDKIYTFIDEPIRRLVRDKKIKINKECSYEDQLLILQEHHKNTIRYNNFITDRGSLDAFTYATYDYLAEKYSFSQWSSFINIHEKCWDVYDIVFILDPLPMEDDNFRSLDTEWQNDIYNLMIKLGNGRPIIVPAMPREERHAFVIQQIALHSGWSNLIG